ncbi:MAG: SH3 domain-containing protein [Anaerolineales bacterium]|nr:SH3 domain-containing protein [Anaerolineales bacterium]
MNRTRLIPLLLLLALVLAACRSGGEETPQDAAPDPDQEAVMTETQKLQDALLEAGVEISGEGLVSPFFSVAEQVLIVNGEEVRVYEYAEAAQAESEAAQVSPDGSTIGSVNPTWFGPPHFYRDGQLIVLYVGSNEGIIEALDTVLGPQFAGASMEGPGAEIMPPIALLQVGDEDQSSGIGTFCWPDVDSGIAICLDKLGLPTPQEPLEVTPPFTARISIPLPESPDTLSLDVIPVDPEDQMDSEVDGLRWWPPNPGTQYDLPLEAPHELALSLNPGLYVFSVFAQWQDFGDVNYGFLVEVPAPEGAASGSSDVSRVIVLASAGLNLRSGPAVDSEVIGLLPFNQQVEVIGLSPDGEWWQVVCPDGAAGTCWITADPTFTEPVASP